MRLRLGRTIAAAIVAALISPGVSLGQVQPLAGDLHFATSPRSREIVAAVQALRTLPNYDVAISEITAAFVDLHHSGSPELFVYLTGSHCGSGGCDILLFEPSTRGWGKLGQWQAGYVTISREADNGWQHVIINHETVWRKGVLGYERVLLPVR